MVVSSQPTAPPPPGFRNVTVTFTVAPAATWLLAGARAIPAAGARRTTEPERVAGGRAFPFPSVASQCTETGITSPSIIPARTRRRATREWPPEGTFVHCTANQPAP